MRDNENIEDLTNCLTTVVKTNYELLKLEAIERTSVIGSALISNLFILLVSFLFILTLSLGAGYYISNLFEDNYSGFAIVSAFYLLIAIILVLGRKALIENPVREKIIGNLLNKR